MKENNTTNKSTNLWDSTNNLSAVFALKLYINNKMSYYHTGVDSLLGAPYSPTVSDLRADSLSATAASAGFASVVGVKAFDERSWPSSFSSSSDSSSSTTARVLPCVQRKTMTFDYQIKSNANLYFNRQIHTLIKTFLLYSSGEGIHSTSVCPTRGAGIICSPSDGFKISWKIAAIRCCCAIEQWFSIDKIRGYGVVSNANLRIAYTP